MTAHLFHFSGRPKTINVGRYQHWSTQGEENKTWRERAMVEARTRPELTPPVEVHVQPVTKDNRRADAGACYHAVKAIIDGFVDAGLIPDDGPDVVKVLHLHVPEMLKDSGDRLIIEVAEIKGG